MVTFFARFVYVYLGVPSLHHFVSISLPVKLHEHGAETLPFSSSSSLPAKVSTSLLLLEDAAGGASEGLPFFGIRNFKVRNLESERERERREESKHDFICILLLG